MPEPRPRDAQKRCAAFPPESRAKNFAHTWDEPFQPYPIIQEVFAELFSKSDRARLRPRGGRPERRAQNRITFGGSVNEEMVAAASLR